MIKFIQVSTILNYKSMNFIWNCNPLKRIINRCLLNFIKTALFFLFFFNSGICQANGKHEQPAHLTLKFNNATVKEVFNAIEKNSEYILFYHDDYIDLNRKVTINVKNESVTAILDQLFKGTSNSYSIDGKQIVITNKSTQQAKEASSGKKKRISGIVVDRNGEPLIGVNVTVKNVSGGTSTNTDGLFIMEASNTDILTFSYVGFLTKNVKVGDNTSLNVTLEEDQKSLEEVVVVGYGKQTKASVVSSVSAIGGKELSIPGRSLSSGLNGRLPGLISVQRNGDPGNDDATFWIRGASTWKGSTNPLILVDGVPRSMNNIEPDEIESFSILKDATATAVYGAEGANGVILITTKRGTNTKPVITFRGEYSTSSPTRLPEFVDSWQYLQLANEALMNDGQSPQFSDDLIAKYRNNEDPDLYPNAKWLDETLAKHYGSQRYTINARGGTDFAKYFVSMAYYTEDGVFKNKSLENYDSNISLNRYDLRSNIDLQVTKSTQVSVDVSGQYVVRVGPMKSSNDIFKYMLYTPSYLFPAIYSDGTISTYPKEFDANNRNPYNFVMNSGYQKEWDALIQSTVRLSQDLNFVTPGLKFKGTVSFDYQGVFNSQRSWNPSRYNATGRDDNGNLVFNKTYAGTNAFGEPTESNSANRKIYIESSLNYDRTFGKHTVGGMLLYMQKDTQYHDNALAYRNQGVVGRASYSYDGRYFIESNFGYTGSETFAKDKRFGFFPSVGIGYYISNEKFYPESLSKVMNKIKLRASIGRTGNDDTGGDRFLYRATFKTDDYTFAQGIGSTGSSNSLGTGIHDVLFKNTDIHWEIEDKRDIGLDLGFFNNQIEITADYFNNRRHDILMQRNTVPQTSGFWAAPWENYGIVTNKGFDGSMDVRHKIGKVQITWRGTLTYAHNTITEYDEIEPEYPWMKVTGHPIDDRGLYIVDRLYTDDDFNATKNSNGTYSYQLKDGLPVPTMSGLLGPGDLKYKDLNNDNIIDNRDMAHGLSNPRNPEISYGFGVSFNYKGFDLSAFFQGVARCDILLGNGNDVFWPFNWGIEKSNFRTAFLDRWTADNPSQNVTMPRLHSAYGNNINKEPSTWWVRSGSFLRFKNLEIGYSIPKEIARKFLLEGARIYVMGNNLCLWDKLKYWDPELSNDNNGIKYPLSRTYTLGLEVRF